MKFSLEHIFTESQKFLCSIKEPVLIRIHQKEVEKEPWDFLEKYDLEKTHFFAWKNLRNKVEFLAWDKLDHVSAELNPYCKIQSYYDNLINRVIDFQFDSSKVIQDIPLLNGGFSFSLKSGTKNSVWELWPAGYFFIPKILWYRSKDQLVTHLISHFFICSNTSFEAFKQSFEHYQKVLSQPSSKKSFYINQNSFNKVENEDEIAWTKRIKSIIYACEEKKFRKMVAARSLSCLSYKNEKFSLKNILWELKQKYTDSILFAIGLCESGVFLGATPETLIEMNENHVKSVALAGSIKRSKDFYEDTYLERSLKKNPKELFEHFEVVKELKQTFSSLCKKLDIPKTPSVLKLKYIQHLQTTIEGILYDKKHILELVKYLHPTPAVSGSPSDKVTFLFDEYEKLERGFYAGPIGFIDLKGNGFFAVALRSVLIQIKKATVFAGAGIVKESIPQKEWLETNLKLETMIKSLSTETL